MAEAAAEPLNPRRARPSALWRSGHVYPRRLGPGADHGFRRERCRRGRNIFARRRAVRLQILWVLVPLTVSLIVVQEMSGRMAAVTGKGPGVADSRGVRRPDHAAHDRRADLRQHVHHRERVRRHRVGHRDLSRLPLHLRSGQPRPRLCDGAALRRESDRARLSLLLGRLSMLHRLGHSREAGLGRSAPRSSSFRRSNGTTPASC